MIVTVDSAELDQALPGEDAGRAIHTSSPPPLTSGRDGCRHSRLSDSVGAVEGM